MFLRKSVLKICSKFTREHACRSVISINLQCNFIEIALWHGCSPVNLLHIFRTLFTGTPLGGCLWKSWTFIIKSWTSHYENHDLSSWKFGTLMKISTCHLENLDSSLWRSQSSIMKTSPCHHGNLDLPLYQISTCHHENLDLFSYKSRPVIMKNPTVHNKISNYYNIS